MARARYSARKSNVLDGEDGDGNSEALVEGRYRGARAGLDAGCGGMMGDRMMKDGYTMKKDGGTMTKNDKMMEKK